MRTLLVAEESAGVQTLKLLLDKGLPPVAALTRAPDGRGTTVATVAQAAGVPLLDPDRVRDPGFARWIVEREVDLLLNVHSLAIADGQVLAAPRIGSFNLHPGPLPRYAGLNAPSWAIYEGQDRHAVTVHWMAAEVDAGPVAYEAWFDIAPTDTGLRVAANCVKHGIPLLERLLEDAAEGADAIPARPQPTTGRRWYGPGAPHDGRLPWSLPARRVVDLVRAADYRPFPSPWGTPTAELDGRTVEIVAVAATGVAADAPPGAVGQVDADGALVATADEWVRVQRLRCDGEAAAPHDVLNPGDRFADYETDATEPVQ